MLFLTDKFFIIFIIYYRFLTGELFLKFLFHEQHFVSILQFQTGNFFPIFLFHERRLFLNSVSGLVTFFRYYCPMSDPLFPNSVSRLIIFFRYSCSMSDVYFLILLTIAFLITLSEVYVPVSHIQFYTCLCCGSEKKNKHNTKTLYVFLLCKKKYVTIGNRGTGA